jgi:hypothetical protein
MKTPLILLFFLHGFGMVPAWLYHSTGIPIAKRYSHAERMPVEWAFHDEGI